MQTSTKIILGLLSVLIIAGIAVVSLRPSTPSEMAPSVPSEMVNEPRDQMEADESMTNEAVKNEELKQQEGSEMNAAQDNSMIKKDDEVMQDDATNGVEAMIQVGSYQTYAPEKLALAQDGDVVLFFRASWCPTCRALDADIRAHLSDIPNGLTILDVNYDDSSALKQKYGVTYQHTFVQVDAEGNQIAKWSGSPTLAALVTQVK